MRAMLDGVGYAYFYQRDSITSSPAGPQEVRQPLIVLQLKSSSSRVTPIGKSPIKQCGFEQTMKLIARHKAGRVQ